MASITKRCRHPRPDWDSCGCAWLIRQQVAGRTLYTPAGPDRAGAERALARLRDEGRETVAEALAAWLAHKRRDPNARSNSLHSYEGRARHVEAYFGTMRVIDVRPEHLDGLVAAQLDAGRAPATVQGIYALLTSALRHAQRRGVIRHLPLPLDGPGIPEVQPRQHSLSLADVETVIARMPGVWGQVAELVLLTGLRWGEVVAIEPRDVEDAVVRIRRTQTRSGTTNAPKTRAGRRVVPLSRRARAILEAAELPFGGDYRRSRDALVHAMGGLHQPGWGWHTLRAAHATLLDAAGVSLRESAARMGHGHHFAQTLAYGLTTEAGSAESLDDVRQHLDDAPKVSDIGAARRRRARRP